MAIRIPILTSFDPKGLRQANAQFAKLQGSIGSLGRNFAVAGAAIAGAGAIIAKNAQSLARIERITAQTESVLKSTGTTANGTAKDIANLAGSLENLTATEAETIQEGANLLLTFKNIQNQAGAGNDIFNQTTAAMVDVARAMGTNASTEAIRLGKALNDPIKGISALSRVGIQFTEDQKAQIKALQQSGDLMGAQKIILAELQSQFGGSGAAYAKTFSGQLELMGHELGTIGEEATMAVMPALQGMVGQFRELIPVIGPQLKAAVESVDFVALGQAVVGFTTFLVTNAETIAKLIAAVFLINTAFKAMQVAIGISNVAIALKTWYMAQLATGMTATTIATGIATNAMKLFKLALLGTGIGALIVLLGSAAENMANAKQKTDLTTDSVKSYRTAVDGAAVSSEYMANKFVDTRNALNGVETQANATSTALNNIPKEINTKITLSAGYASAEARRMTEQAFGRGDLDMSLGKFDPVVTPGATAAAAKSTTNAFQQSMKLGTKQATAQGKLQGLQFSQGYIDGLLGSQGGLKQANALIKKATALPVKKQTALVARENKKFAGTIGEVNRVAAENAAASAALAAQAAADLAASIAAAEAKEAAALAERERVYASFADSVKNTFAGIKNSIIGAFDLTQLGGSTNSITRNMDKLLTRLRSFATNVKSLATMGLNPALLQQIISAGPMAGARLAEGLAMGGQAGLSAINAGYAEFGTLSGQIAQTGTESLFGTSAQQSVYNINVDGGVGSGATIGKAIVDAIKAYERTSGAVWQGA
jgi:hypothetical protein